MSIYFRPSFSLLDLLHWFNFSLSLGSLFSVFFQRCNHGELLRLFGCASPWSPRPCWCESETGSLAFGPVQLIFTLLFQPHLSASTLTYFICSSYHVELNAFSLNAAWHFSNWLCLVIANKTLLSFSQICHLLGPDEVCSTSKKSFLVLQL